MNVVTHTGTVHAGRAERIPGTGIDTVPACSRVGTVKFHFIAPTTDAVTCRKCLAGQAAIAAKPANGITAADGTDLLDDLGMVIKSERTAQSEYVDAAARAAYWSHTDTYARVQNAMETPEQWRARCVDNAARLMVTADRILAALAAHRGTTVDEQRATLAPKVAAKARRDWGVTV